ncbi:MAG: NAD(P)/FAD-dependent oxidoreductase [Ilumatobacter sp.]|nr:NAD(P)/FAD-dependent oxidoreductase [Ilumatobacter sp.]
MSTTAKHRILIVGGGTAGITVAARLLRKGYDDVAVIEPSDKHYYQALWTLVGGGQAKASTTERAESSVMPKAATWIKQSATGFDPENNTVTCGDGSVYEYDVLVVCPGIQLDWEKIPGVEPALGRDGLSSNYRFDLAPKTWDFIRNTRSGTAVFTMPSGPIKCAGAPQKIAYLAADHWKREGVLGDIDVHLVVPTPRIFGIPEIADNLDRVIADYGINLHVESEVTEVDAAGHKATVSAVGDTGTDTTLPYDVLHVVPHQSAPDWIKSSPLSTGEGPGYVEVDKHTMQHVRYPNVFSLGDAGSTPNSKTGAAIRKQAPVVVENIDAHLKNERLGGEYHGYASCPLVTSSREMLLAEFDYSFEMTPTFPKRLFDPAKPHRAYWYLKKYGLPFMYWNLMLKGLA